MEKQCEVAYHLNVREYRQGGLWTFEARIQCVDGRQFDAVRREDEADFTFRTCGTTVC